MTHHRRHSHCSCTACPLSLPTRSPNTQNRRRPGRTILQKHGSDHLESCCNMLLEHQTALHSALHTREQPGRTFLQSMLHEHQMALVTSTHTTPGGGRKGAFVTAFQCLSVSPTQCLSALQHTRQAAAGQELTPRQMALYERFTEVSKLLHEVRVPQWSRGKYGLCPPLSWR